jgi:xanthine dehydrogenase YagT iron-sulfur-binding subunit
MGISINGSEVSVPLDVRVSLLDFVREQLELPGTKQGCNQGACGACTVLLDGERVLACLLAQAGVLHPLQQAFIDRDGLQCGYCTPGQICSAIGMAGELARGVPSHVTDDLTATTIALDHDELRERMSGNLCRCGAHNGIVEAITEVYTEAGA